MRTQEQSEQRALASALKKLTDSRRALESTKAALEIRCQNLEDKQRDLERAREEHESAMAAVEEERLAVVKQSQEDLARLQVRCCAAMPFSCLTEIVSRTSDKVWSKTGENNHATSQLWKLGLQNNSSSCRKQNADPGKMLLRKRD